MQKNKKILVIDDEEDILDFAERVLKDGGYEVGVAKDAKEALSILGRKDFNLILLDIMLPEIDGWELMKIIKGDERLKKIPIAMLTARLDAHNKIIGLQEGAVDYICKPFTANELLKRIAEIFRYLKEDNNG